MLGSMDRGYGGVHVEYVSHYRRKEVVSGRAGGGGIAKIFFEAANILRLHITFSKRVGVAHPHSPPPPPPIPVLRHCCWIKVFITA